MKLVRYNDSPTLRDALSFFAIAWGLNKVHLAGLVDVLITMFLNGEISTDKVSQHYKKRADGITKLETERLLKYRHNR